MQGRWRSLAGLLVAAAFLGGLFAGGGGRAARGERAGPGAQLRPASGRPSVAPATAQGPVDGGILTMAMFAPPRGLFHPLLAESAYDGAVLGLVFRGLLTRGSRLEWVPELAESYEVSADNLTITFRLRRDVRWHDGRPFTARDVAFTLRTILHPRFPGVRASGYLDIAGARAYHEGKAGDISGVRVTGDHEVVVTLVQPYAPILEALAVPIIPAHVFAGVAPERMAQHPAAVRPIGTGPYRFVRFVPDQYVELARNLDYYRGRPHIDRLIYKLVNQEMAAGQLLAGELDYMPARPEDLELVGGRGGVVVHETPGWGYQFVGINHRHPLLGDRRVRQALMYAVDRRAIVDQLLSGHGAVVNGPVAPASWAYDPSGLNPYPYDPDRAAALLAQAGFRRGRDGWLEKDGRRFEVSLRYPGGNKVRELSAPLLQDNLKRVGIKVNLEMLEFATLSKRVFEDQQFDLFLLAWALTADPDPGPVFLPNNKWGRVTGWTHPTNEELIWRGVRQLQREARRPTYAAWNRLLNSELPYLFLYTQNEVEVASRRIQGLKPDARGLLWNVHELWLAQSPGRVR